MQISRAYYLIVDVEATCSGDGAVPRDEMEIIEIGAVMLAARTLEIESEFQVFVRPVRHPVLTDFCTELTGITQESVSGALMFPEARDAMIRWSSNFKDWLFCSWGDYDRSQFLQDCEHHKIDYPLGPEHMNLKAEFSRSFGLKKRLGVTQALKHVGLKFEGAHHRGLDDAKNISRIVRRTLLGASDRLA